MRTRAEKPSPVSYTHLEAEEFKEMIQALGLEILHRDYDGMAPIYRDLCPNCDFLRLCRTHEDWEEPEEVASLEPSMD